MAVGDWFLSERKVAWALPQNNRMPASTSRLHTETLKFILNSRHAKAWKLYYPGGPRSSLPLQDNANVSRLPLQPNPFGTLPRHEVGAP